MIELVFDFLPSPLHGSGLSRIALLRCRLIEGGADVAEPKVDEARVTRIFQHKTPSQAGEGGLAGIVERHIGQGVEGCEGGDVNDDALPLIGHLRGEFPAKKDGGAKKYRALPGYLFPGKRLPFEKGSVSCIVDQKVGNPMII